MLQGLSNNEEKEAWHVVRGLDSVNFLSAGFDQWWRANAFEAHAAKGLVFTVKGTCGYVQFELARVGGQSKVVNCWYISFTDISKAYPLVKEGISISGKSLSRKDLELLKKYRYEQVEHMVKGIIENQIGRRPELRMKLRDDLGLDEDLDIPEIVMELEDKFDCIIDDDAVKRFKTVEDVISFIRKTKGISI